MNGITYLLNVHWGWIKQRPQFLAEELSKFYKIDVYFEKHYRQKKIVKPDKNQFPNLNINEMFRFPLNGKISWLNRVNHQIIQNNIKKSLSSNEIIWYSKPDHVNWYHPNNAKGKLRVYDCMDDMLAFPTVVNNRSIYDKIFTNEKLIVDSCEIIFASSHYLANKIRTRYNISKPIHIVNNGMTFYAHPKKYESAEFASLVDSNLLLTYVGTIAEWFDFDSLIKILDATEKCKLVLFGPTTVSIPQHPKIVYMGSVQHEYVEDIMKRSHALLLPFLVNDLIESVNPVKMYEYISSGNFVFASSYGETEKFAEFAYLYKNFEELLNWIQKMERLELQKKQDPIKCLEFGKMNTWSYRAEEIKKVIETYG